jgi:hypothetical protein
MVTIPEMILFLNRKIIAKRRMQKHYKDLRESHFVSLNDLVNHLANLYSLEILFAQEFERMAEELDTDVLLVTLEYLAVQSRTNAQRIAAIIQFPEKQFDPTGIFRDIPRRKVIKLITEHIVRPINPKEDLQLLEMLRRYVGKILQELKE